MTSDIYAGSSLCTCTLVYFKPISIVYIIAVFNLFITNMTCILNILSDIELFVAIAVLTAAEKVEVVFSH